MEDRKEARVAKHIRPNIPRHPAAVVAQGINADYLITREYHSEYSFTNRVGGSFIYGLALSDMYFVPLPRS